MVANAVRKKYAANDITVTLINPRAFMVNVTGIVLNQGSYLATAVTRADKVIIQANRVYQPSANVIIQTDPRRSTTEAYELPVSDPKRNQVAEILQSISTRNIKLRRKDGTIYRVDIPKFYATGEDKYNPFLLEGDVLFIPRRATDKNFISVSGAVNDAGSYEYGPDESLLTATKIAKGVTDFADLEHVVISRLNEDGSIATEIKVNLAAVMKGETPDVPLRRGDRVWVPEKSDARRDYRVYIQGEVRYSGSIPITRDKTKLSDIIRTAGGFTPAAFLPGSTIIRQEQASNVLTTLTGPEYDLLKNLRSSRVAARDSAYFYLESKLKRRTVVVDFYRLFALNDTTQDVTLQAGDIIFVPAKTSLVYVYGQVASPGWVPYKAGAKFDYYIEQAGGYSERADVSEARLIKQKTQEWREPDIATIEEGDYIFVPRKPVRDFAFFFNIFRDVLAVAGAIATIALLIVQVNK
jgi:protein involved in polysaccharide export with SLBB domain